MVRKSSKNILEQILGSKTRVKLLTIFLLNTDREYFVRELTRISGEQLNSVRRELGKLGAMGLIASREKMQKKFYYTDLRFRYLKEFKNFVLHAGEVVQERILEALRPFSGISLIVLAGAFVDLPLAQTDLLIVGSFPAAKVREKVKIFEHSLGREIKYVMLSQEEYEYRLGMGDQFLHEVLNNDHLTVLDKRRKTKR